MTPTATEFPIASDRSDSMRERQICADPPTMAHGQTGTRLYRLRRSLQGALLGVTVLWSVGLPAAENLQLHDFGKITDPDFGAALFFYYKQDYFNALSYALVADKSQRIKKNKPENQQLLAELYLAYGLIPEAENALRSVGQARRSKAIQDRSWFKLAQANYRRGHFNEALETLNHIGTNLNRNEKEQAALIRSYILMARNQNAPAIRILDDLKGRSLWGTYARYNLGIALLRNGKFDKGVKELTRVGKGRYEEEELIALRDQANLALGYLFLRAQEPAKAKSYFERIRLNGAHANRALLGIGWANLNAGDPKAALAALLELHERPIVDPAVLEAYLAVPYAFAQLQAYAQALEYYETAIDRFEQEIDRIDQTLLALDIKQFLIDFSTIDSGRVIDWLTYVPGWPSSPESRAIFQLISKRWFQEALRNYRDLQRLQTQIHTWIATIDVYDNTLGRRIALADATPNHKKKTATTIASLASNSTAVAYQKIRLKSQKKLHHNVKTLTKIRKRAIALQPEVERLAEMHAEYLKQLIIKQLMKDKSRTETYLSQARLLMAQIYDQVLQQ